MQCHLLVSTCLGTATEMDLLINFNDFFVSFIISFITNHMTPLALIESYSPCILYTIKNNQRQEVAFYIRQLSGLIRPPIEQNMMKAETSNENLFCQKSVWIIIKLWLQPTTVWDFVFILQKPEGQIWGQGSDGIIIGERATQSASPGSWQARTSWLGHLSPSRGYKLIPLSNIRPTTNNLHMHKKMYCLFLLLVQAFDSRTWHGPSLAYYIYHASVTSNFSRTEEFLCLFKFSCISLGQVMTQSTCQHRQHQRKVRLQSIKTDNVVKFSWGFR